MDSTSTPSRSFVSLSGHARFSGKPRARRFTLLAPLLAAALPGAANAGDWYVDAGNPSCPGSGSQGDPFCAIQEGINAATNGDTVHVAPGTYVENIDFLGKAITVQGTGGAAVTIIDGNQAGTVVTFQSGESASSVLDGFTVTNGSAGGVLCNGSSPTITNSTITGNSLPNGYGGGIASYDSSVTITDSTISANTALCGGGISFWIGAPTIADSIIQGNFATNDYYGLTGWGGGITCFQTYLTIRNTIISGNEATDGGGIASFAGAGGGLTITDSTVHGNIGWWGRGGGIFDSGSNPMTIRRTTISGNYAYSVGGIYSEFDALDLADSILWGNGPDPLVATGPVTVTYTDIAGGWTGTGNIDADPLFVDAANGDFRLRSGSPCIDAGDPTAAPTGTDLGGSPRFLDGDLDRVMRVDMGAHEFDHVHLAVTGTPAPGGRLTFDASGTAGMAFIRILAFQRGEILRQPFGALFLDPSTRWMTLHAGTIPDRTVLPIPPSVVTPLHLIFQDIAIDPRTRAGNTSNPVELVIE